MFYQASLSFDIAPMSTLVLAQLFVSSQPFLLTNPFFKSSSESHSHQWHVPQQMVWTSRRTPAPEPRTERPRGAQGSLATSQRTSPPASRRSSVAPRRWGPLVDVWGLSVVLRTKQDSVGAECRCHQVVIFTYCFITTLSPICPFCSWGVHWHLN